MIDYIAVDNRLRREVEDTKVMRGLFSDSDHFAVVAKVRMREQWEFKGSGRKEGERRELASERFRNSEESQRYIVMIKVVVVMKVFGNESDDERINW